MSQADIGNITAGQTGPDFFDNKLEPWRNALHSLHSGSSRPSYAVGGMLWLDTTTTPWLVKMFDGTDDIIFGSVNATTNVFTPYFAGAALALAPFIDSTALIRGSADASKLLRFEVDGFTTGTTRVLTPPNYDGVIATLSGTETLANKTLTDPILAGSVLASNFAKTSDTTFATISGFLMPVTSGGVYEFEVVLDTTSNAAGGVKVIFNSSGGAAVSAYRSLTSANNAAPTRNTVTPLGTNPEYATTAVTATVLEHKGSFVCSASGSIAIQFAQNVSNAAASTVLAGSYWNLTRVA